MNQQGYIVEVIDEKTAKLKMQRHSACASCGKCITSSETKDIVIEVDNSIGANVGDHVVVSMEHLHVMKATMIAYIFPLISLLGSTIITYYTLEYLNIKSLSEIISAVVGILATGITFLYIKKNDEKFRESRNYIPVITKIIM